MNQAIIKRYQAFWEHEAADRPILFITVPDKAAPWEEQRPANLYDQWENPEARYDRLRFTLAHTGYYGEAMPQDWVNFGPGCLAAMMGSDYIFKADTVWFGEGATFIRDWSGAQNLSLLDGSAMYRMVMETTRLLTERSGGDYLTGISDLGGNLDVLASLRDTQDLLTDLIDAPEAVLRATEQIDEVWKVVYTKLRGMLKASGQHGHVTWLGPWCDTTYYPLQCDFSAMISPDDFARFVMPSLRRISAFLDHSIYHLDGPGQIAHLDHLLSLPRLDGIQWVPGDGNAPVWDESWFPLYEKIQKAGKALVLHGMQNAGQVLMICKNFSARGLWMSVMMDSREEAEALPAKAAEISR